MQEISPEQRRARIRMDNPWWEGGEIHEDFRALKPRASFDRFARLATRMDIRRAVVLMGLRRVGKTVLLHHLIKRLLDSGLCSAREIGYISLDRPLYTRLSIEELADEVRQASRTLGSLKFLFLDEIQYLPDWERHLKVFVDTHPETRCVASGSAAAALRLKSIESGAGRFTDFLLPPLTFFEHLDLQGIDGLVEDGKPDGPYTVHDLSEFNRHFLDYVNFGGYPEAFRFSGQDHDFARHVGSDIVEKVLLRDLPSLYGIQDVPELYALFNTLAYNTAGEVSLEPLAQDSGASKITIKRYLEYLEAAFLIKIVHRVDRNARRFKRANRFKTYVTAPALHCALFGPAAEDDPRMGALVETAVFAQWPHSGFPLHYGRWKGGEVDIVYLDRLQKPNWCVDIKWSDRHAERTHELKSLMAFTKQHPETSALVTTRSVGKGDIPWPSETRLDACPASLYCYIAGHRAILDPASVSVGLSSADYALA